MPVDLPDDIIRLILEELFVQPEIFLQPEARVSVLLLAKHVRAWLEPLLFRHLELTSADSEQLCMRALYEPGLAKYTRSLYFESLEFKALHTLLSLCTNINQLAVWVWCDTEDIQDLVELCFPTLHSLSVSVNVDRQLGVGSSLPLQKPLFHWLTHLDISVAISYGCPLPDWRNSPGGSFSEALFPHLGHLRYLTHLSLNLHLGGFHLEEYADWSLEETFIEHLGAQLPQTVKVVIFLMDYLPMSDRLYGILDPRMAVAKTVGWTTAEKERLAKWVGAWILDAIYESDHWRPLAREGSGEDLWSLAERALVIRRQLKDNSDRHSHAAHAATISMLS